MPRLRKPSGSSDGGQFARETGGATNIPTPSETPSPADTCNVGQPLQESVINVQALYDAFGVTPRTESRSVEASTPEDPAPRFNPVVLSPALQEMYEMNDRSEARRRRADQPFVNDREIIFNDSSEERTPGGIIRCPECGRFTTEGRNCNHNRYFTKPEGDSEGRGWTGRETSEDEWTTETVSFYEYDEELGKPVPSSVTATFPSREELTRTLNAGGQCTVEIYRDTPMPENINPDKVNNTTWGRAVLKKNNDGTVSVDTGTVYCSCHSQYDEGNSKCRYVQMQVRALRMRIAEKDYAGSLQDRISEWERVLKDRTRQETPTDWTLDPNAAAKAARAWLGEADVIYSVDPNVFISDLRAARKRMKANHGRPVIPYRTENVLDGACRRGSGQAFGIEVEYDFPPNWSRNKIKIANEKIGKALYAAGLTSNQGQQAYHSQQRSEYRDTQKDEYGRGTWMFEDDGSVSGEIVSPGMYDEPDTWNNIQKVVTILRSNGAVPSVRTGMHVHVGTSTYEGSPAAYTELARMANQYEDVMYRLAADPVRGTHRDNGYSEPLPLVPPEGFATVKSAIDLQSKGHGRSSAINMLNCDGSRRDHVEFRLFDGTLDAGAMQTQIMMAVGMTDAAERIARSGGSANYNREPLRSHYSKSGGVDMGKRTPKEIVDESWTLMSFLDTIYRRHEDKAQASTIVAATRWTA